MRASRRPKNSSMNRRATCVESTRSVGEWKLPTFSAREWRSAAADALGANGSCTCTMSSGATLEQRGRSRALASSGSDTRPPRRAGAASVCIGASTRTSPGANSDSGSRGGRPDQAPRLAHQRARAAGREHEHAVPALREPVGERARRTRSPRAAPPTGRASPARSRAASRGREPVTPGCYGAGCRLLTAS